MKEVGATYPGRGDSTWDEPSDDFQPRAPGRIKSAAAAAQAKRTQPPARTQQGDAR